MLLYVFILLYLLIGSVFFKKSLFLYSIIAIIMYFTFGLRDVSVGTDTKNYIQMFNIINSNGVDGILISEVVEPAWLMLNKIIYYLGGTWSDMILVSGLIVLLPVFFTFWKFSANPFLSLLLYYLLGFYFSSFNILRQMIAVSIVFFAYSKYFNDKKILPYCIFVLLASSFHFSALVSFSIPILVKYVRPTFSKAIVLFPISLIVGFYVIPAFLYQIPVFGKYAVYLTGEVLNSVSETQILFNIVALIFLSSSDKENDYLKLFYISVLLMNLFGFSEVIVRSVFYFQVSVLLLSSNLNCKYNSNKLILELVILLYGILFFSRILANNSMDILPYATSI